MGEFRVLDYSESLRQHRPTLEANWNQLLASLTETERNEYFESLNQNRDPARHVLFEYFLYCGAIEAEIRARDVTYFHIGLTSNKIPHITTLNSQPADFKCSIRLHNQSVDIVRPILSSEILPLVRRLLLYDTSVPGRGWIDFLQNLESFVNRRSRKLIENGVPASFVHFRFHNLNRYFDLLGEAGADEMITHIEQIIRDNLVDSEMSIVLSPHSVLVLSPGSTKEQLYERFQALYFEIKSLVLDYELLIHTITDQQFSLFDVLRELKI
ncbi:MAG: hypothetical protein H3C43_10485 [Leptonema sp. (in: Bacteria)]|nr:hypothetical protein [Leptonema sp. (in: bacteria)]